jgi:predicted O-methyltransferase YrrM
MSPKTLALAESALRYLADLTPSESEVLRNLRERTRNMPGASMQIAPEQGQFMRLLLRLVGARRAIEIGVYTGYSSTCIAMELPREGLLLACDTNAQTTSIATEYWRDAGVVDRIRSAIAPAEQTLMAELEAGNQDTFDFAFIDADKTSYDRYYELCLQLLRPGGLIAVDNALWSGRVAEPNHTDADTQAIRELNAKVARDPRVFFSLVPIGDGLLLARKQ